MLVGVLIAGLLVAACSPSESANSPSSGVSPDNADQVVIAFTSCLKDEVRGWIRVDLVRFAGVIEQYTLASGTNDRVRLERIVEECRVSVKFDETMDAVSNANPLADDDLQAISSEYRVCAVSVTQEAGPSFTDFVPSELNDFAQLNVELVESILAKGDAVKADALNECYQSVLFGPKIDF